MGRGKTIEPMTGDFWCPLSRSESNNTANGGNRMPAKTGLLWPSDCNCLGEGCGIYVRAKNAATGGETVGGCALQWIGAAAAFLLGELHGSLTVGGRRDEEAGD